MTGKLRVLAASQAAADAQPSGMVSVIGLDASKCTELVEAASAKASDGDIVIANYLCNGNYACRWEFFYLLKHILSSDGLSCQPSSPFMPPELGGPVHGPNCNRCADELVLRRCVRRCQTRQILQE